METDALIKKALRRKQDISGKLQLTAEQVTSLHKLSAELRTEAALQSIRLDPYWHKWDSPWWKVLLLSEAGYAQIIPREFLEELISVLDTHCLHVFPLTEAEMPANCNPYRDIMCHCALGSMYRVFEECGIEVRTRLPWWYNWLQKYQLPDGGYNCDEAAYTKSRKSSFLSTLPMLEAMLIVYQKTHNSYIKPLLDKGAQYLLKHSVYKSSSGKLIAGIWLSHSFPRYYDYDVLRGLSFLVDWAGETGSTLPSELVSDCFNQIEKQVNAEGYIILGENKLVEEGSLYYRKGEWIWDDKSTFFPALDLLSKAGEVSIPLTIKWYETLQKLSQK